jgi:hypothetical protein
MKTLLDITAFVEVGAGLGLLCCPSAVADLLLRSPLYAPASVILERVTGAALLSLGVACWLSSGDAHSRAARGLVTAMLLYNVTVAALLAFAAIVLNLVGIALWPAVVVHAAMAGWCISSLTTRPHNHPTIGPTTR